MALTVLCMSRYALLQQTSFDYFWHGTSHNHPIRTTRMSCIYLCFLLSYGCHIQTHTHLHILSFVLAILSGLLFAAFPHVIFVNMFFYSYLNYLDLMILTIPTKKNN